MKNFFRKVAFGIKANQKIPADPLKWATDQVQDVPNLTWKGKIYTEKELRSHYRDWVYGDRKQLRVKYKNDKTQYRIQRDKLRNQTGQRFWESLEISIRHNEAINSKSPVLAKLWYFWGNHFAISDKDQLANYSTGAYQREIIRANLNQKLDKLVYDVTTSWTMLHHLDNGESVGPKSEKGKSRKKRGKVVSINENHARELLELHTVSPNAGYTQEDIIQLAYIMTGWRADYNDKDLETANVNFDREYHQPGKKNVLGKTYKNGKKSLEVVIKDLVNHPNCRDFIAYKLCRYLITDNPTEEMKKPIIKAFEQSDGFLPEIHKAAIKVAFDYNDRFYKFQNPENWFLQMVNTSELAWPISHTFMDKYKLGEKPFAMHRWAEDIMREIGHHPYRAKQPNGWSDISTDWLSPELLIRRLVFAKRAYAYINKDNANMDFYQRLISNNFNNPDKILSYLNKKSQLHHKHVLIFNHPEFLKA